MQLCPFLIQRVTCCEWLLMLWSLFGLQHSSPVVCSAGLKLLDLVLLKSSTNLDFMEGPGGVWSGTERKAFQKHFQETLSKVCTEIKFSRFSWNSWLLFFSWKQTKKLCACPCLFTGRISYLQITCCTHYNDFSDFLDPRTSLFMGYFVIFAFMLTFMPWNYIQRW